MAQPSKQQVRELILPVFTQWEKVGSVTGILQNLENGIFYDGSLLVEQMLRDDRVRGLLNTLIMSVLGAPRHFEAAEHTAGKRAQKVADEAEDAWPQMMPSDELYEAVRWSIMLGVGVQRPVWQRGDSWIPQCQTWHPGALYFNLIENEYYLYHQGGSVMVPRDSPDWLLWTPYSHKYGRLNGLVRSLAMVWLARQWVFRDRARHSEVHGMPFRQMIVPADADKRAKDNARQAVQAVGTETVLVTPQGVEGKKYDVKLVEAQANSHQVFSAQLDHLDDCMAILILGQKMSSKGATGLGSDANPGDSVRRDIMRWLADVIETVTYRLLRQWAMINYGDPEIAPRMCIEVDPPADGKKRADEMSVLGDVVAKLASHGLDIRQLLEESGVPMLSPEEAQAQKEQMQQEAIQNAQALASTAKDPDDDGDDDSTAAGDTDDDKGGK